VSITKTGYSKRTRRRVLLKTRVTCAYCGKALDPDEYGMSSPIPPPNGAWEVDHWIPKSSFKNPWDAEAFENLWPACSGCNDEKSSTTGEEYIAKRKAAGLPINTSVAVVKRFEERSSA
jgi:5-methylcytosine-specific restriction endonuclease McrA